MIDQTAVAANFGAHGWLAHPRKNTLLLFRGDLLHGVLPAVPAEVAVPFGAGDEAAAGRAKRPKLDGSCEAEAHEHGRPQCDSEWRITLMVGLWPAEGPPQMPLPPPERPLEVRACTRAPLPGGEWRWAELVRLGNADREMSSCACTREALLHSTSPIWRELAPTPADESELMGPGSEPAGELSIAGGELDMRFFVHELADLMADYGAPASASSCPE